MNAYLIRKKYEQYETIDSAYSLDGLGLVAYKLNDYAKAI
jgi:hypothetical protein